MRKTAIATALSLSFALIIHAGCSSSPGETDRRADRPAPLFKGMGSYSRPASTDSKLAKRYFDQGLTLAYAFNHAEATRSFEAATKLDPDFALAWWGIAYTLGPNINKPMDPADNARAYAAAQKAVALKENATPVERALIDAMAERYAADPPEDRSALDKAFADAMRKVYRQFPDDPEAATVFADAMMNTMPWDYWTDENPADASAPPRAAGNAQPADQPLTYGRGSKPKPGMDEAIAAMEKVIAAHPDQPGAPHLYIHLVEAGPNPRIAEPVADRLADLVPGAGHLVHMPAHIYVRVGRYHDAVEINYRAAAADEAYIAQCNQQGFYPAAYYPHNMHFIWFAAGMGGEGEACINAAKKIVMHLKPDWVESQRLRPTLIFALVKFAKFGMVLEVEQPPADQPFAVAMWHYGRALAFLHKGRTEDAMKEAAALDAITHSEEGRKLEQPNFFGHRQLQIADAIVKGLVAEALGNPEAAVAALERAVKVEDSLPYMEPPYWPFPARHELGALLLRTGDATKAEAVYRDDLEHHPENGWSLHGLHESLLAQGKNEEAAKVKQRFDKAWRHADASLDASTAQCPCVRAAE